MQQDNSNTLDQLLRNNGVLFKLKHDEVMKPTNLDALAYERVLAKKRKRAQKERDARRAERARRAELTGDHESDSDDEEDARPSTRKRIKTETAPKASIQSYKPWPPVRKHHKAPAYKPVSTDSGRNAGNL